MELWDIYDENRKFTGRTIVRGSGERLKENEFHLAVHIWVMNSKGEFLIQKRASTVQLCPNLWATTGGSVISGEDSHSACVREMNEEIGVIANMEQAEILLSLKRTNIFCDVWLIRQDFDISQCRLQVEEVSEVKWATIGEILELTAKGAFWEYRYLDEFVYRIKVKNEQVM
ncbi:MAG TPA: NUDIX domain-containing protein [Bacillota bacterium]|nr:NUDIX domain-containing protein [Bacillota bacterium]